MEIEFQNKNTVTWCLEREGPHICLKATIFGKELQSIEIMSENFSLKIEYEEAKAFVKILSQMTLSTIAEPIAQSLKIIKPYPTKVHAPEPAVPRVDIQQAEPEIAESITPEFKEPESEIEPEDTFKHIEPEIAESITPEFKEPRSEIESEDTFKHIEPEIAESIFPEYKEPGSETEPKIEPEDTFKYIKPSIIESIVPEYKEKKYIEVKQSEIETASFFRSEEDIEAEDKSPLEHLLEEGEQQEKELYTPDDFKDGTFSSRFDTKSAIRLIETLEPEPDTVPEPQPEFERAFELKSSQEEPSRKAYPSEIERKKAIEKERAERRRRLWELTRGF